jgi:hypothetical protein
MSDEPLSAAWVAEALSECVNLMSVLAAPNTHALLESGELARAIAPALRDYLEVLEHLSERGAFVAGEPIAAARAEVVELLERVGAWSGQLPVPPVVIAAARRALGAMQVPEPPGGWDEWDGSPDALFP